MKSNKIYIPILILLFAVSAVLVTTVVELSAQKEENKETISQLNRQMETLKKEATTWQKEKKENQEKIAFFKYQENVFQSKYPKFTEVSEIVFRKSKQYGFSPYLVMALIQVESNFDAYAVSNAGAYGLTQVNYEVWKDELNIDFSRIFEKEYNIDLGLKVLKHYYDKNSGNMFMALYRYNNGYKYNNEAYNGKIVATKFFSQEKERKEKAEVDLSI